jgi:predicted ribosome quality control (RQC) complex YloA/Tae2 family protein
MFDILTSTAMVEELSTTVVDGRVQRTGLFDQQTLAIEIYASGRRHHLVATTGGPEPALYRTEAEYAADPSIVTPFALLLRKHVRGGTVAAIDQPALDRVIRLSIAKRIWGHKRSGSGRRAGSEGFNGVEEQEPPLKHPQTRFTYLYVEIMGRRSNLILVNEDGVVLDSLKRVPTSISQVRPILPSRQYVRPPEQIRFDPRTANEKQLASGLADLSPEQAIDRALVTKFAALSPQMAREAAYRAMGKDDVKIQDLDKSNLLTLASAIRAVVSLLDRSTWSPSVYFDNGAVAAYSAVSLESMRSLYREVRTASMSEAVERFRTENARARDRHLGRRARLLREIMEHGKRFEAQIKAIDLQRESVGQAERYRHWGDLIYAHLWEIDPNQSVLDAEGEAVPLDPERTPKDVANEYFQSYRRMQRGQASIEDKASIARKELDYLTQLEGLVRLAETFEEIEQLRREWEAWRGSFLDGPNANKPKAMAKCQPGIRTVSDTEGNSILIGKTGLQNDHVTFGIAGPDDYWLHARGVPGSHVVVRAARGEPSERALERAAALAAYYSAARSSSRVEVDICRRRYVRKIKDSGPGMVTYRNERSIAVEPANETEVFGK